MDYKYFSCERYYIENIDRIIQKQLLIKIYCSQQFEYVNFVDMYYNIFRENVVVLFVLFILVLPVLYLCIFMLAEKYVSAGINDMKKLLRMSPMFASMTIIALANGAPELMSAVYEGHKHDGFILTLGSCFGGFIFNNTLVLANVAWQSTQPVKLPKLTVIKELGFYLLSVLQVIVFGLRKKVGRYFLLCNTIIYVSYLIVSYMVEQANKQNKSSEIEQAEVDIDFDDIDENRIRNTAKNRLKLTYDPTISTVYFSQTFHIELEDQDPNYQDKPPSFLDKLFP